jgi:tetratricopeptide (TPR) repeat protein
MLSRDSRRIRRRVSLVPIPFLLLFPLIACTTVTAKAGEPAEAFLNQLRAAGYFDMAIEYLDRLDGYPGVSNELASAVLLEKAQTFIDAAVAARQIDERDEFFKQAEEQLGAFLKAGSHPRQSQARLQLGRLQMVRAAQLQGSDPDQEKITAARKAYLAAAGTFDTIVESLREKLKEMQGAKIDPKKDPDKAAQRDQYRGEFLEGIKNAGEARLLAAQTFDNPADEAKEILEKSLETFTELSDKYESYVQGACALAFRGEVQSELGMKEEALDSFIRMLEQPDVDALREAKFRAVNGMIEIHLAQSPPEYQQAIDSGEPLTKDIRPNEKALPIVQKFRLAMAKAFLAKSADKENQQSAAMKRAESSGRQLLLEASKIPGPDAGQASELLAGMGVEVKSEPTELPTAEDPASFEDALVKARKLLVTSEGLKGTLALLEKQGGQDASVQQQKQNIETQMRQAQVNAVRILRIGISMIHAETDATGVNQARQLLAYMLYQQQSYRGASVVGEFLARTAAGTDIGLKGGLLALNSLRLLLAEDSENAGLALQLEDLGNFLTGTWPNDPKAAAAQSTMLKLALRASRYEEANELIEKMPDGAEKLASLRLMGRILWNDSFRHRKDGNEAESIQAIEEAEKSLRIGLQGIDGKLAGPEVMKASLALAKVYLQKDDVAQAAATLDNETYGPLSLSERRGMPDKSFASDLYGTELRIVVQQMTSSGSDPQALLTRAGNVMENLRSSVEGPDAEKRLTSIYIGMARDIREQLERSDPGNRAKLIDAFRLFLERIASTTDDPATLQWTAATLIELAESSMGPNKIKADGQSAELLKTAVTTLETLKQKAKQPSLTIDYQLGRAQRMLGNYKQSIDTLDGLLTQKSMMLDAQIEAALAYEQWAAVVPPKFAGNAYKSALKGGRPNAKQENTIWGWGKIGQLTMRDPKHKATFFEARYHVALCRYRWGKAVNNQQIIKKSATDITRVHALHPDMGGDQEYKRFDQLLKTIQKELGEKQIGLKTTK